MIYLPYFGMIPWSSCFLECPKTTYFGKKLISKLMNHYDKCAYRQKTKGRHR